jgi:hypothetical protein
MSGVRQDHPGNGGRGKYMGRAHAADVTRPADYARRPLAVGEEYDSMGSPGSYRPEIGPQEVMG